jgi:hypothetical protein
LPGQRRAFRRARLDEPNAYKQHAHEIRQWRIERGHPDDGASVDSRNAAHLCREEISPAKWQRNAA